MSTILTTIRKNEILSLMSPFFAGVSPVTSNQDTNPVTDSQDIYPIQAQLSDD